MSTIEIRKVTKQFGAFTAVKDADLKVDAGEVVCLLGPSGCGKTTTLRCVAGLEHPTGGRISIGGRVVSEPERGVLVSPRERDIGMVFQSYAVWPHMTVRQNVAYPLKYRKNSGGNIKAKVDETLELVGLGEIARREQPTARTNVGDDRLRPLSGKGRAQSVLLADRLAPLAVGTLVSSPYLRCVETLQPLAEPAHDRHRDLERVRDEPDQPRTHDVVVREPAAERRLDHGVDRLGVADSVLDQRDRLAPQGVLQPVADEARNVLLHMHHINQNPNHWHPLRSSD